MKTAIETTEAKPATEVETSNMICLIGKETEHEFTDDTYVVALEYTNEETGAKSKVVLQLDSCVGSEAIDFVDELLIALNEGRDEGKDEIFIEYDAFQIVAISLNLEPVNELLGMKGSDITLDELEELGTAIEEFERYEQDEPFLLFLSDHNGVDEASEGKDHFEEAYNGHFDTDEDFAEHTADSIGAIDRNLSWPYTCIDWEQAAKDLMWDYFTIESSDGTRYYFRSI